MLYADDTNLFVESKTFSDLYVLWNQATSSYNKWFTSNRQTVNKNKTLYVIFHKKMLPAQSKSLTLDNVTTETVQNAKFLGVLVDQHSSWDVHIPNAARKWAKFVPIMYESRQYCTDKCLRLHYIRFVYLNLVYCNAICFFFVRTVPFNPSK